MQVIRINKDSIKKNPDTGKTRTVVYGAMEISFACIITQEELNKLEKQGGVFVSTYSYTADGKISVEGYLDDYQFEKYLPKEYSISVNKNSEAVHHLPLPQYLYEHEKSKIKCNNCKSLVDWDKIEVDYDEDGNKLIQCPICKEFNTFDYRFETIEEALNE